jgi:DNA-binding NarL/FixJ family response regulator
MLSTGPVSLFIVEDQPIVRAGLLFMLQRIQQVRVIGEAADGRTAVAGVLESRPDVTLMDIGLAGLDGIDATRQIKQGWPEARILILTAHESEEYVFASLAAGADGYCLKNASADQLITAIHTVKSGAAWLDPGIARRVLRSSVATEPRKVKEASEPRDKFALSPRELEVLQLLVDGLSNQDMAERLVVSVETIKTHMRHIMEKLVVSDRTQAAVKAVRQGLI